MTHPKRLNTPVKPNSMTLAIGTQNATQLGKASLEALKAKAKEEKEGGK